MGLDRLDLRHASLTKVGGQAAKPDDRAPGNSRLALAGTGPLPLITDDKDLVPLLRQASSEQLAPLVEYITRKGGATAQLHRTLAYKQNFPSGRHEMYADDIAAEIQKFGANTFCSQVFRQGRGVKYRKILKGVAKRCRVSAGWWDETSEIEKRVLAAVLSKSYERMTERERQQLLATLEINRLPGAGGPVGAAALQTAIQSAGFAPYKIAVIAANGIATSVLGHGLAFASNAGLTKGIAVFAGPVGWALDAIWGGMIVAGPAYRVTIPCVVQIAMIRQSVLARRREGKWRRIRILVVSALVAFVCILAILVVRHFIRQ